MDLSYDEGSDSPITYINTPITPSTPYTPSTIFKRGSISNSEQGDLFHRYVVSLNRYSFPEGATADSTDSLNRIVENGELNGSKIIKKESSFRKPVEFSNGNKFASNSSRKLFVKRISDKDQSNFVPVKEKKNKFLSSCFPCLYSSEEQQPSERDNFQYYSSFRNKRNIFMEEEDPEEIEIRKKAKTRKRRRSRCLCCSIITCVILFLLFLFILGAAIIACVLVFGITAKKTVDMMSEKKDIYTFGIKQVTNMKKGVPLDPYPFQFFKSEWELMSSTNLTGFLNLLDNTFKDVHKLSLEKSVGQIALQSQMMNQLFSIVNELDWFVGNEIVNRSSFNNTPTYQTTFAAQQRVYYLLTQEKYLSNLLFQMGIPPSSAAMSLRQNGEILLSEDRTLNPNVTMSFSDWDSPVKSYISFMELQVSLFGLGIPGFTVAFFALPIIPFGLLAGLLVCLICTCCSCIIIIKCVRRLLKIPTQIQIVANVLKSLRNWDFNHESIKLLNKIPDIKASDLIFNTKKLVKNLEEMRPYLSNILDVQDEDEQKKDRAYSIASSMSIYSHAENDKNDHKGSSYSESQSHGSPRTGHRKSIISQLSSKSKFSNRTKTTIQKKPVIPGTGEELILQEKHGTLMMISFPHLHDWIYGQDADILSTRYNKLLCLILETVKQEKGVVHYAFDDTILVSFGCSSRIFLSENHACQCALSIVRAAKEKFEKYGLKVNIGITTGKIFCGKVGNRNFKTFSCVGQIVTRLVRLCQLNEHYMTDILLDIETYAASQTHFISRLVDYINISSHPGDTNQIYELIDTKMVRETEWMYQLSESEEQERFKNFHAAWEAVIQNDFDAAEQHYQVLTSNTEKEANFISRTSLKRLQEIINTSKQYEKYKWRYNSYIISLQVITNIERIGEIKRESSITSSSGISMVSTTSQKAIDIENVEKPKESENVEKSKESENVSNHQEHSIENS